MSVDAKYPSFGSPPWSDCSVIKFGDYYGLYAMRSNVEGWSGFLDFWAPNIRKS